ncbi:MAG: DUF2254 domain-containing protein [Pseudonocardia sp.]|nr:DUF2254 domain-containing protein [Pseudonocardia sp.]
MAGAARTGVPAFHAVPWWHPRRSRRLRHPVGIVVGIAVAVAALSVTAGPQADGPQVVTLLQAAGFGALGLVSLVFSLLFLVVQWVSSTYSPRLILFRRSALLGWTIVVALGLFSFAFTAAVLAGTRSTVSVLVPVIAGLGTLAVIAMIWRVQVHALSWVQVSSMLAIVVRNGRHAIDQVHPAPVCTDPPWVPPAGEGRVVRWQRDGEILQRIDTGRLVRAASATGAVVVFRVPVGTPLREGLPLADVRPDTGGGDRAGRGPDAALDDAEVRRAVVAGLDRTFEQDPAFALRLLADVGLRALSPAVNDPATAVQALDGVHAVLQRVGSRDLTAIRLVDDSGTVRVVIPVRGWEELLTLGVDDVSAAVLDAQPMVRRRIDRLLTDLLDAVPESRRTALHRRRSPTPRELTTHGRTE